MADVFGTLGGDYVELNNAATEATLKALLASSNKAASAIAAMAKNAGIKDADLQEAIQSFEQVNQATTAHTVSIKQSTNASTSFGWSLKQTGDNLVNFTKNLAGGTATASSLFAAFRPLPGVLGLVATGLSSLISIQEENFKAYRNITDVGVNFGGSLTDLRMAATKSYMSLDEFGALMKKHSGTLAKMGGNTDEAARNFSVLSHNLISSDAGRNLLALGYSTQQVNDGMLSYIDATGGRTTAELKGAESQKKITQASAEYLEELDGLARITGESREQQQKDLQEASRNVAFQAYLQDLDEDSRKKAMAGLAQALAVGGKGAADVFQSKLMGLPPLTKEGQQFQAMAGKTAQVIGESADMVGDGSKTLADMNKNVAKSMRAAQEDFAKYGKQGIAAMIAQGGPAAQTLQKLGLTANRVAKMTDEEIEAALKKQELESTQAASMAELDAAFKEATSALMSLLMPAIKIITPFLGLLGKGISVVAGILDFLITPLDWIADGFVDLWKLIKMVVVPVVSALAAPFEWLAEGISKVYHTVTDFFSPMFTSLGKAFGGVTSVVSSVVGHLVTIGKMFAGLLIVGGAYLALSKLEYAQKIKDYALAKLQSSTGFVKNLFGKGGGVAEVAATGGADSKVLSGVSKGVSGIGSAISGIARGAGDAIKSVFQGLASGLKALGDPKVLLGGVTLGLLASSIYISAKGFQEFAKVSWEEMGKGFLTLAGLGVLGAVLSVAAPELILAGIGIAALSLSLIPLGIGLNYITEGLQKFSEVSWADMAKGFATLAGLGTLGAVLGIAAPFIMTGAVAIGALGIALIPFGIAVSLAGPQMENLARGLTMLSDVSAFDLLKLSPAIAALGLAMIPLGAGLKIAGSGNGMVQLTNNLSNLSKINPGKIVEIASALTTLSDSMTNGFGATVSGVINNLLGVKTPIDQLKDIASVGPELAMAGSGIQLVNQNLTALSGIDSGKLAQVSHSLDNFKPKTEKSLFGRTSEYIGSITSSLQGKTADTKDKTKPKEEIRPITTVAKDNSTTQLEMLNKQNAEMLRVLKEIADHSKRNVDATKGLNGNLFPSII